MLYAAYGSKLHPLRLTRRTASAEFLGTARVAGYRLTFDKRGRDGSGKCSIAGDPAAFVCVAVYALSAADRRRLDDIEGLGRGYARAPLDVPGFGRSFAYVAEPGYRDALLKPYDWYRDLVLLGCRRHDFPRGYRAAIEALAISADADALRRARNLEVLRLLETDVTPRPTPGGAHR